MKIKELTIDEFNSFANSYNIYSIYQTNEYAFVMQNQNFQMLIVGLIDNNNNILAASILLVEKRLAFNYAYSPRGFLIDYSNLELLKVFTNKLKKYLSQLDIVAVKLSPPLIKNIYCPKHKLSENNSYYDLSFFNLTRLGYYHYGYNYYFEALKPRYEAIIDISKPYYMLFSEIKKEYRTKIRSAEKNGIKIYKGKNENLEDLYKLTKNKYPRDLKYFEDLINVSSKNIKTEFYYAKLDTTKHLKEIQKKFHQFDQENLEINNMILANSKDNNNKLINRKINSDIVLASARKNLITATNLLKNNPDGIVLAAVLIATYRDTVYLLIDGYDPQYKNYSAKHLLIWKLMEKYSKLGYKKFNLGGISNYELDENKYKGLNEFKLNFGAKAYEYAGDFEIITNNTKYFMYRQSIPIEKMLKK